MNLDLGEFLPTALQVYHFASRLSIVRDSYSPNQAPCTCPGERYRHQQLYLFSGPVAFWIFPACFATSQLRRARTMVYATAEATTNREKAAMRNFTPRPISKLS